MSNYSLIAAGPSTVKDAATKKDKSNTLRVLVPSVNPAEYPQLGTAVAKVKGENKTVVALDLPADVLTIPKFESWEGFTSEAKAAGKDAEAKALEAVNDALALGAASERRKIGANAKSIPANPVDMFADVAKETVSAFFNGVQKAMKAAEANKAAASLLANIDLTNPEVMAAKIAEMKKLFGVA